MIWVTRSLKKTFNEDNKSTETYASDSHVQ